MSQTPKLNGSTAAAGMGSGQAIRIDVDRLIPLVVGAHPRAEQSDRPIAYRLRERMHLWLSNHADELDEPRVPLVVTDVWYLNDPSLRDCPAISIGGPSVNACTAYLADKLPSAFVVDDVLMVQMDLAMADLRAACWGMSSPETLRAVDAFCDRYLDQFMSAAVAEAA